MRRLQQMRKRQQQQQEALQRAQQQRLETQPSPTKANKQLANFWIQQGIFKGDVKILVNYALDDPAFADV